jgi:hypothetical protein
MMPTVVAVLTVLFFTRKITQKKSPAQFFVSNLPGPGGP